MLRVDGIDVYYGRIQALKDVSLKVEEGTVVSLLGANGAGKTTLMNTISGFLPPARGEISYLGSPLSGKKSHEIVRLGIGHVSQHRTFLRSSRCMRTCGWAAPSSGTRTKCSKKWTRCTRISGS